TTRQAGQLLMEAGEPVTAGVFLPTLDEALARKDAEGLNLLARHFVGLYASEKKTAYLERAWTATQAVLAQGKLKVEEQKEAVQRAVGLPPKGKEGLGQAWLDQSFTKEPERGMLILSTVGSLAADGMVSKPLVPEERLKVLELQRSAVDALLKASPQRAMAWH